MSSVNKKLPLHIEETLNVTLDGGTNMVYQMLMSVVMRRLRSQFFNHLALQEKQMKRTFMMKVKVCLLRIIMMNLVMKRVRKIRQPNVRLQISENKVKCLRSRMKMMRSMNIYIKVSKFEKHAPEWRKTQTPVRNSCFSGSGFSTPPRNLTALVYLKSFWLKQTTRGEIEQLIGIQMYMSIVNLLAYVLC